MPYQAVVFDLDGTLLNTLEDLYLSVNRALAAHDLPRRTRDEVRLATGNGIARLIERSVGPDCPADLREKVFADFKADYGAHSMDRTAPYQGIVEVLDDLRAAGVCLAVVSNKADFAVQGLIATVFPGVFDCVMGENEAAGIRKKPAPDMVWAALDRMGVGHEGGSAAAGSDAAAAAHPFVYVGDSEVDLQTAKNLGCPCIACTWGFRDREWLVSQGAKTLVDTPKELGHVLLGK